MTAGPQAPVAGRDVVTVTVAGQLCAIDVLQVRDVLGPQALTPVPLAPGEVAGLFNLRGRIVTAIDLRRRLGLDARAAADGAGMSVVVERAGVLYGLIVDSVGEVVRLPIEDFGPVPASLGAPWRKYAAGVYRLQDGALVMLDGDALLDYRKQAVA